MYIMFLIPFLMCGPVLVCGETHRPIDKQPQLAFFFGFTHELNKYYVLKLRQITFHQMTL